METKLWKYKKWSGGVCSMKGVEIYLVSMAGGQRQGPAVYSTHCSIALDGNTWWSCGDSDGLYIPPQRPLRMCEGGSLFERGDGEKTASSWITLIAWLNVRIHSLRMYIPTKDSRSGKILPHREPFVTCCIFKIPLLQNTKKEVLPLKGSGKAQWQGHHICPALPADRVVVKGAQWWGFPGSLRASIWGEMQT